MLDAPYLQAGTPDFPAYAMDPRFQVKRVERTAGSGGPAINSFLQYHPEPAPKKRDLEGWVRWKAHPTGSLAVPGLEAAWWPRDQGEKWVENGQRVNAPTSKGLGFRSPPR